MSVNSLISDECFYKCSMDRAKRNIFAMMKNETMVFYTKALSYTCCETVSRKDVFNEALSMHIEKKEPKLGDINCFIAMLVLGYLDKHWSKMPEYASCGFTIIDNRILKELKVKLLRSLC